MNPVSIVIADAQYLIRVGLRHIIEQNPALDIVAEVTNENSLLSVVAEKKPEVLVLDYAQEECFSTETIQKVKGASQGTNVLIISGDEDKQTIYEVLESGVNSFLTKQCDEKEIHDAIVATAKGERFYCSNVLNYLLEKSFPKGEACKPLPLSAREIEIVQLISSGLIAKEIAHKLNLSTHTIYTHRKNIMKKLGLGSTSELVLYAVEKGIV